MITVPYLLVIALATGAATGGYFAWTVQGHRIERLQLQTDRFEATSRLAVLTAQAEASKASERISALELDLEAAHKKREQVYVETIKEVEAVASPTRACLTPDTRRVLQRDPRPAAPAKDPDPRVALGIAPTAAADPGGSTSEQAVALWITAALRQYSALRDQHRTLADVVRSLPCVKVE